MNKFLEKIFGKHKILGCVISLAVIAAIIICLIIFIPKGNEENKETKAKKETTNEEKELIISGTISEDGTTLTTDDGKTYTIKDGKLYETKDGKDVLVSDDLSKITIYDEKGHDVTINDNKIVANIPEEETTTAPVQEAGGTNQGENYNPQPQPQPQPQQLPWVYSYPTESGIYKVSDGYYWIPNCMRSYADTTIPADAYSKIDKIARECVAGRDCDGMNNTVYPEIQAIINSIPGYENIKRNNFSITCSYENQRIWENVQERCATTGYVATQEDIDFHLSWYGAGGSTWSKCIYVENFIVYDASTDTANSLYFGVSLSI